MHGNVDSPLGRSDGDHEVQAEGWMQWDQGETSAVITVGITQGSVSGSGSETYEPDETTWDIGVIAGKNGVFQGAQATASVTAVVSHNAGPTTTINWTTQVQLN